MTYSQWLQLLIGAENSAANAQSEDSRVNSLKTVELILERLACEGITRDGLKELAKSNG